VFSETDSGWSLSPSGFFAADTVPCADPADTVSRADTADTLPCADTADTLPATDTLPILPDRSAHADVSAPTGLPSLSVLPLLSHLSGTGTVPRHDRVPNHADSG
jgi:hypothetical protein